MAKKYITQEKLKKKTLSDIFALILEKKQTTRREIEYETGFSWGTVSSNVALLLEKGYIQEEKAEQNGGAGRTTLVLKPAADRFVSIGLDINRQGFSCEVVALDACVVMRLEAPFTAETQAELLAQAEAICRRAMDWCEENTLRVFSLGIAMQGSVNGRFGISMHFPRIADWQAYNVKEHFARKFSLPVYLGHDPKCMLLGEMHRRGYDDCVLLRVDSGIGMAVSLDGRILDDTDRFELGHTLAVADGSLCSCGRRGCLEVHGTLSAVRDGSEEELREAGGHLSRALYNVYTLFKPQRVILTGKAVEHAAFTESAIALLREERVEITVDPAVSASYGAAVESVRSAVGAFALP